MSIWQRIRCAFGRHEWVTGDGHWRRWCIDCGCGSSPPPVRPHLIVCDGKVIGIQPLAPPPAPPDAPPPPRPTR